MRAISFNKGLTALVISEDTQVIPISAVETDEGYSVGMYDCRVGLVKTETEAVALVNKLLNYLSSDILVLE